MATTVSAPLAAAAAAASTPSPHSAHRPPLAFPPSSPFRRSKPSTPSPSWSPSPLHPPPLAAAAQTPPPSAPVPASPSVEGSAVPQYLRDLAMSGQQRTRYLSREPSLPSIMSMPRSRPTSPSAGPAVDLYPPPLSPTGNTISGGTGRTRRGSGSNSIHQQHRTGLGLQVAGAAAVAAAVASQQQPPSGTGRGRASNATGNLRAFEEGVGHYERVRSPSLRGHSRRGSWSSVDPLAQSTSSVRRDVIPAPAPSTSMERGWSGVWSLGEEEEAGLDEDDLLESEWLGDETIRDAAPQLQPNGMTGFGCEWADDADESDAAGVWKVGERLGVGTLHQGALVRDLFPQSDSGAAPLLEVVRQVGVGSYAVVYLVREVLYDPFLYSSARQSALNGGLYFDPYSSTPRASSSYLTFSSNSQPGHGTRGPGQEREGEGSQTVYGRDFALKCLCKRNLSEDLLLLQRGEAELHRALPMHPNIVALHRALETPGWLFLVIEYCPGQDLFYWLEQARDSENLESFASRTNSFSPHFPPLHSQYHHAHMSAEQHTPPSPSLLAAKSDEEMLSRRRIRLISRMFAQMGEAVQACHAVGVCHRDIKPENFIVVDERAQSGTRTERHPPQQQAVTVKITDWGLGTHLTACDDFDCGSKPYMAYECRNNLNPTYDPVQADVWSLGIVLLNLLYHRCPWADPVLSDPDFAAFRAQPVAFLLNRFEGMTEAVAMFLASRVFCEVNRSIGLQRVTAGQFGMWTRDLLHHLGGGQAQASASEATIPMSPSSARGSSSPARMPMLLDPSHRQSSTLAQSIRAPNPTLPTVHDATTPDISTPPCVELGQLKLLESPIPSSSIAPPDLPCIVDDADSTHSPSAEPAMSDAGLSERHRRRKRGARKGKRDGLRTGVETAPVSPSLRPVDSRDILSDMAEASQTLAREISHATKTNLVTSSITQIHPNTSNSDVSSKPAKPKNKPSMNWRERFTTGGHAGLNQFVADSKAKESALFAGDVASAPAKLQQHRLGSSMSHVTTASSGVQSTISSLGTSSWGSYSVKEDDGSSRGRSGEKSPWASASSRRERLSASRGGGIDQGILPARDVSASSTVLERRNGSNVHTSSLPSIGQHHTFDRWGASSAATQTGPSLATHLSTGAAGEGHQSLEPIFERKAQVYRHGQLTGAGGKDASTSTSSLHKTSAPEFRVTITPMKGSNVVNVLPGPLLERATNHSTQPPPLPVTAGHSSAFPTTGTTAVSSISPTTSTKAEGKTKLASLLTSFKRFNQSVGHLPNR